jgi:pyruvate carboxylase
VKTNIPFLENVIHSKQFRDGGATTTMIDTSPELFAFKPRRDRASKLLAFLGNVIVNGNPHAKGHKPAAAIEEAPLPKYDRETPPAKGTRELLLELGPKGFAEWTRKQKRLLVTDTTFRDAHQSLMATRVRTYDMMAIASAVSHRTPNLFSLEMWGGATFDTAMRFLNEDPWVRLRNLREKVPNICFQMLLRGANAVGYTSYPPNVVAGFIKHAAESGVDIFRVFDSLNDLSNMKAAMEAVQKTHGICEGTLCYTGDILDPKRSKYSLKYYVKLAKELVRMGAHFIAIKDMAGLCRPYAAQALVKALRDEIGAPIHFHTHDTSGINAASILRASDAGVDVVDLAIASMSGSTSQPNLNSVVAALQHTPRETGLALDTLNEFSDYWEKVREFYTPFDTAPKTGSAEVYLHEMPGGQFTNLKEQAASMGLSSRWPEIARTYAEVNELFGDIVKVTPSSKVVGDMALFLFTRGIRPADVVNLPPGTPFPESVRDMLSGGLGEPMGGWPKAVVKAVLGTERPKHAKPLAVNLRETLAEVSVKSGRPTSEDDLYSHLMYPQVFADFAKFQKDFSDVSVLPTPAFFYGLKVGEEISVSIEEGKVLFIKLIQIHAPDKDGRCVIHYELNGMPREVVILDKTVAPKSKPRSKADAANPLHVGAPIPGMVTALNITVGGKVAKGDKIATLEAMKMQTTLYAHADGVVEQILAEVGDAVESGDLLAKIRE